MSFISRLLFGHRKGTEPYSAIQEHIAITRRVWRGREYDDIGLERVFRLLLLGMKFLFPALYLEHLAARMGRDVRLIFSDLYILLKAFVPLMILHYGLSAEPFWLYFNLYLLLETFTAIFNRIYLSEHFNEEGYKRMFLLLFFNFIEVVFSFAVIYSSGSFLYHPFKSNMDAVYFSMMTSSTIAYGDNYPITDAGRAVAVIQAMTSLIFLGLFFNFFNNRLKD